MPDNINRFYPDLEKSAGVVNALQTALSAIGAQLTVKGVDRGESYARVESAQRSAQVFVAAQERMFLFDFWSRGAKMAQGQSPNLADAAQAIHRWLGSTLVSAELASEFRFVTVEPNAAVFEAGNEVEAQWQHYLATVDEQFPELVAFVQYASRRPELRQLFPFTSVNRFGFSRCTGAPYTSDIPLVEPLKGGKYRVAWHDNRVLGTEAAEIAAELVVQNLPAGCGPAVAGTAKDF